jgi:threonine aldolase
MDSSRRTGRHSFASDNCAGVQPELLAALAEANVGHADAYGYDAWTARAEALLRERFGERARAFLVSNGTGANVCALRACTRPWEGVVCAETAHLNGSECAAPEVVGAVKLLTTPTPDGKLTPALIGPAAGPRHDEHHVRARVVSVAQCTEYGTTYRPGELRALADAAHADGMLLHVDGARLANAAAWLDVELAAITSEAGADVVSFGGTKNGAIDVEAVIVLNPDLVRDFPWVRKQSLQLASKGRFAAAQVIALLEGDLWRRSAAHANAMAARLAAAAGDVPGVEIVQAVESNAVFATLDARAIERLQREWPFYVVDPDDGLVRWMCAWDTTPADVDAFATAVAEAMAALG